MITPNEDSQTGGSPQPEMHESVVPFTMQTGLKADKPSYKPYGEIIQLDWTPKENIGGIEIPKHLQAKMGLPFFKVLVIAAGDGCKQVKAGDYVLMPQQVILHAKWDAETVYFSSESKILAVVSGG